MKILVGYPYHTPEGEVTYSVGLPMGGYSTWAAFALAHHYVLYWVCREIGMDWFSAPYVVLGDDVVIGDDHLAKRYREVMEHLGVEVSPAKTWVSPHALEFAKRYFYRGAEVTPFPISAVCDHEGDIASLVAALQGEERKGLKARSGIPGAIAAHKRIVGRAGKPRLLSNIHSFAVKVLAASAFLSGRSSAVDTVCLLCGLGSAQRET
jgi:hypothetical protein